MNSKKAIGAILVLIVMVFLFVSSAFRVREGFQVIITEFGKPVGNSITEAGLHFKKPFIQEAIFIDKRLLNWDGDPNEIPTKDNKFIWVDTTARWKIVDPLKFIQTVQTERIARSRLDDILDASTRDVISNHNLVEAVRNSNTILDLIKARKSAKKKENLQPEEEEFFGDIESISVGREKLSQLIVARARKEIAVFGIELVDVQLRRIAYEESVQQKVYERMISERKRIAEKIRSVGRGEKAKIEGKISRDLQKIQSQAYRKAQEIKGKAEAKATRIYARSLSKNPGFYEFTRTLEAYRNSIGKGDSSFILSTSSDFLKLLKKR